MRILYLQHVDWNWIPQRPHFLAAELSRLGHDLHVFHLRAWRRSGLVDQDSGIELPVAPTGVRCLPRWSRPVVRQGDAALVRRLGRTARALRPDVVWVTHPRLEPLVRELTGVPVVYDCMDLAPDMAGADHRYVRDLEARLAARANTRIASSPRIADELSRRYPAAAGSYLVRNACRADFAWPALAASDARPDAPDGPVRLLFFGTIGPWLDMELLAALATAPGVRLKIIGPVRTALPPEVGPCVSGAMPQLELLEMASTWSDVLLLPFRSDDFAESVDPVKLYEYVGLDRPILAPPLRVLQPAGPFLSYYRSVPQALAAVRAGVDATPGDRSARQAFVADNTWSARAREVDALLAKGFDR
ncbi:MULTISPECIES: glycosyltransferase [Streptomyces]|uniref:glycosyltransferase n=1 Tax=Streptomyces TaxID=1883 RepID=UPI000C538F8A|nr:MULTISPECIES: glycosyltransferase [Streptomyces]PIB11249.1 hypothetical protein B1C81_05380 [Streptomyces sp. HG99]